MKGMYMKEKSDDDRPEFIIDSALDKDREIILETENLSVLRSGEKVIKNANLKIMKGDYIGIVGPNGGGKSTLIKSILGLIPYSEGKIKLFGKDIKNFNDWNRIAYVAQDSIKFDESFPITVRELVSLGRINRYNIGRKFKDEDMMKVDGALELMDVKELANKRVGNLSGGQKQRVFVAKAIARDPDIIFLDEPVAGVDPVTQENFYKLLSNLNHKRKTTILIVSHDLSVVFCRMSKVICINRDVYMSDINDDTHPEKHLQKVYGEHFHFVFHKHECRGDFDD